MIATSMKRAGWMGSQADSRRWESDGGLRDVADVDGGVSKERSVRGRQAAGDGGGEVAGTSEKASL